MNFPLFVLLGGVGVPVQKSEKLFPEGSWLRDQLNHLPHVTSRACEIESERHVVAPFFDLASALGIFITSISTKALLPADTKFEHLVFEAGNEGDRLIVKLGADVQV